MIFELGVNTYMTVEEADSIINDEFDSTEEEYVLWNSLDEKGKQRIILKGTRAISGLVWRGLQYHGYQQMAWPRLIQYRYVECPYEVKAGILAQALKDSIANTKQETKLQELGVRTYSIKGASISFTDNINQNKLSNGVFDTVYREYFEKWMA